LLIEHFEELRTHLKKIKVLILALFELIRKEKEKIGELNISGIKELLEIKLINLQQHLQDSYRYVIEAINVAEKTLKVRDIRMIDVEKNKLRTIIVHIAFMENEIKKEARVLLEKYQEAQNRAKEKEMLRSQAIPLQGRLRDGWRLNDIQAVIIDIGGKVVQTKGGEHPYKIIFPNSRTIPLGPSTPPNLLIKEVSFATGVKAKVIEASFNQAELISA